MYKAVLSEIEITVITDVDRCLAEDRELIFKAYKLNRAKNLWYLTRPGFLKQVRKSKLKELESQKLTGEK